MSCATPGTVYSLQFKVCVWKNSVYDDCMVDDGENRINDRENKTKKQDDRKEEWKNRVDDRKKPEEPEKTKGEDDDDKWTEREEKKDKTSVDEINYPLNDTDDDIRRRI
ncbi:hypothetical protein C0Q70_17621 [Pomacea canaliculata]|uniref:Uncharacterized protein n=1 Tax=Pomacea canaliculata TaxID=400727 RepID=A0A2T7NKX8_POMCA|nr:hypothetical protein C0Q70_17621 [Pomacea canaliculata]